ncbi:unnamed protein product [Blepharisma stoltei]|uniref:Uncharacterized protein n=1 Tax=Blepharisma stoltei TaxID=1481888 RepID=A0AAU9K3F0_9CILI|nr:unnamed protein product [Blepharisma stoltei]
MLLILKGALSSLFNILKNCEDFRVSYQAIIVCKKCPQESREVVLEPILDYSGGCDFENFLDYRLRYTTTSCKKCKNEATSIIRNILWPKYLFIVIDEAQSALEYENIKSIKLDNESQYDFIGEILYKNQHFTTVLKNPYVKTRSGYKMLSGSYHHDGMRNDGQLTKLTVSLKRFKCDQKPYILAYKKVNKI